MGKEFLGQGWAFPVEPDGAGELGPEGRLTSGPLAASA